MPGIRQRVRQRTRPVTPVPGTGRAVVGVLWAFLVIVLWLWGGGAPGGAAGRSALTTGDMAAVGRPPGVPMPAAHAPFDASEPRRVEMAGLGLAAPVVVRGLDERGAVAPPPFETPDAVGWYGGGARPGEPGVALLVGHADTETRPAVFHDLSTARPGRRITVTGADGRVAEFTVDDVRVFGRERFDARDVYGPREDGRAELRLITCGGAFDRASGSHTANVVVSAYLTGMHQGAPGGSKPVTP
ncbi:class F sortase [Streptomyces sp. ISL-10]|uniref:class F sortase n=1 Tax=Streptomyces sp. ISL-10 TaxID=2819172 RepID=UPI001BE80D4D|nr:class F sortase [Streptomyces sp. ISL-10]MBT2367031.1 class F sortase [Streptomyces sp. ISL-10]